MQEYEKDLQAAFDLCYKEGQTVFQTTILIKNEFPDLYNRYFNTLDWIYRVHRDKY